MRAPVNQVDEVIEVLEMSHAVESISLDEQSTTDDGGALASLGDSLGMIDPALQKWDNYTPLAREIPAFVSAFPL